MGWDDVPHLTPAAKAKMLRETAPHMRNARRTGEPAQGKGRIYPIDLDEITVHPFRLPDNWPRAYGFDPSPGNTAALWGAIDPNEDTIYFYSEHFSTDLRTRTHSDVIKTRGNWIHGVSDPAVQAMIVGDDGKKLLDLYVQQGLILTLADNAVRTGIAKCYDLMTTGRLKVFSHLQTFRYEFLLYKTDDKGRIMKERDHLMDACRYFVMSGRDVAQPVPKQYVGLTGGGMAPAVSDTRVGF